MQSVANAFVRKRLELGAREGRSVSDWQVAALLGIQPRHVYNLSRRPSHKVRPAFVLALELAIERGISYCDEIDDPSPSNFASTIDEIPLSKVEVARHLGIVPRALRYMRSREDAIIPRHHVLAVHYLHLHLAHPVLSRHLEFARHYEAHRGR